MLNTSYPLLQIGTVLRFLKAQSTFPLLFYDYHHAGTTLNGRFLAAADNTLFRWMIFLYFDSNLAPLFAPIMAWEQKSDKPLSELIVA